MPNLAKISPQMKELLIQERDFDRPVYMAATSYSGPKS